MLRTGAGGLLLAGPVVLAFFSGGYFDVPRGWAGLVAWLLVAVGCLVGTWPRGRAAWLAIGGLAALAGWTLLSLTWAPLGETAYDAGQIAFLYLGALTAAALLRPPRAEEALLLGTLVVVGYGVSERLLPGLLDFAQSISAQGRLEQPLTYWNAMGLVAATGLVLSARPDWRLAAAPILGLGLSLTVSRGGLLAAAAGLICLVVLARRRDTLAAAGAAVGLGGLAAVSELGGSGVMLAAVIVLTAAAVPLARACAAREGALRLPAQAGVLAVMVVGVGIGLALVFGSKETSGRLEPTAGRLVTLQSNRYEYWRVAARAFKAEPVRGIGAGGWAVRWRRERPFDEAAHDAHSLPLQTLAELGLVGFVLLAVFVGGVGLAAREAGAPLLTAVCVTWGVHTLLDWDWQMPAATLPAIIAAGVVVGRTAVPPSGSSPLRSAP